MSNIRTFVSKILFPHTYCNEAFVKYLKSCGAKIGKNTRFIYPKRCNIDINRAEYISIGNNCCLSEVSILAHDYSWYVALEASNMLIPDPGGQVIIGNNCFIGFEALILKNTVIGDNVIIGARSVVSGSNIPSNTVWAGVPAKQICTLEEYIEKRKKQEIESLKTRKKILDKRNNYNISDFGWFMFYFLPRTEDNYERYIKNMEFNGVTNSPLVKNYFFSTPPLWQDYNSFLNDINKM